MASITSAIPTGYVGAGGSEIIPCVSCMYISYQSPAPSLPGGWLGGPPEAARVPLLFEEARPPLWRGVDGFPLCLGAVVIPLWPEVDGRVGFLSAPPGGWLTPVWLLPRGSRGWSLGLGRLLQTTENCLLSSSYAGCFLPCLLVLLFLRVGSLHLFWGMFVRGCACRDLC